MYGSCIRFYNTLLTHSELEEMKEDLIERLTSMLFYNDGLTGLVVNLCKIATQEEEQKFTKRLAESVELDITPLTLNVSKYFTLAKNSKIEETYLKQLMQARSKKLIEQKESELEERQRSDTIMSKEQNQKKTPPAIIEELKEEQDELDGDVGGSSQFKKKKTTVKFTSDLAEAAHAGNKPSSRNIRIKNTDQSQSS